MSFGDRIPPYNIEAEEATLGSIMAENDLYSEIAVFLRASDFYRENHQKIYRTIAELSDASVKIDCVSVAEAMSRKGEYRDIGGEQGLREIMDHTPNGANGAYYAGIVHELSTQRHLLEASNEISRMVYSRTMTASQLAGEAERLIFAVGQSAIRQEARTIRETLGESLNQLALREDGIRPGLQSGFRDLDGFLDGFQPRKLYILAARPSIGKSALALNIADHIAMEGEQSVLFLSLEMDRVELADRLIMSRTRIDGHLMRFPKQMTTDQRATLDRTVEYVANHSKLTIDDPTGVTITQVAAKARRHKARYGLGLLVVDYLQLIDGERAKGDNREQEIAKVSRLLKAIARELYIPVLALCQLNRMVESRDDRKPRISDIRESGQVEQDADCVMLLHRPEYYDPAEDAGIGHVIIAKNKGGPTGQIKLGYTKSQTRFYNLEFIPPPGPAY